jgi:DNA-binding MarR family transcriptional regulator
MKHNIEQLLEIKDFIALINGRASAAINRYMNKRFKEAGLGITTEQWSVLTCLWERDKQTQQNISEQTFKDKASVTRLLDNLEKNGLVKRESSYKDRRINLIHLTDKGIQLEKIANGIVRKSIEMSTNDIDMEDLQFIINLFKKILNNLESDEI